jgi:thioredoxin 1
MISYITELNEINYKKFTESGLVLIDIKTDWCGPCKMISPLVDEISSDYHDKGLSVGKLDADSNREIVTELGIRNIPTILLYKNGEIVDKSTGAVTKQKLVEMIDKQLS